MTPLDVIPLAAADLGRWEPAWRGLEARAPDAAPFLCFDWLAAWARTHDPERLAVVIAGSPEAPLALGLIERARGARWRFGGWPVSSTRGLLVEAGAEDEAWIALGGWLRAHSRRWATLDAEGVQAGVPARLPGARTAASGSLVRQLPDSVEAYLARCPREVRRAARRATRTGAELRRVPPADAEAALADFVRLHEEQWQAKGTRHAAMGSRLAVLLGSLRDAPSTELHLGELVLDGRRVAVSVALSRGDVHWNYNFGIDPAALPLGPGIALQQLAIREAIEGGRHRFDMGPGIHAYKLRAGGVVDDRVDVLAVSPSARGRAMGTLARMRTLARRVLRR
jgi:CelD/BcsL family acetyltransferase involved in cellulose biosynthesis